MCVCVHACVCEHMRVQYWALNPLSPACEASAPFLSYHLVVCLLWFHGIGCFGAGPFFSGPPFPPSIKEEGWAQSTFLSLFLWFFETGFLSVLELVL